MFGPIILFSKLLLQDNFPSVQLNQKLTGSETKSFNHKSIVGFLLPES